jgi:ribulose-phosphate 3-epimerase
MKKTFISPSILSIKEENLASTINILNDLGLQYLHVDVMDGQFVPAKSLGVSELKYISSLNKGINDVHIMIANPLEHAQEYIDAGADILTFHLEACSSNEEVFKIIEIIHSNNKLAGLCINPYTDVEELLPYLNNLDLVLIMSVQAGAGAQAFLDFTLDKIRYIRKEIDKRNLNCLVEADGGIKDHNVHLVQEAGADLIVSGSYIFSGDIKERYNKLVEILCKDI